MIEGELIVITLGGKVRPFDMMLKRALDIAGEHGEGETDKDRRKRLVEATDQVLREVDEE